MKRSCGLDSWMKVSALGMCLAWVGLPGGGVSRVYAQTLDSGTSACRQNPALCLRSAGEEVVVPGSAQRAAEAGISLGSLEMALNGQVRARVEQALVECADQARSQVLVERLQGRSPSEEECKQLVPGTDLTLAMLLGQEMHQVAARCAGEKLSRVIPGRFSLEPRYRYDPGRRVTTFISEDEAQELLRQGRGNELKGTLRPDVVIHSGDPLQVQAIYDFKFGCTGKKPAEWTRYPAGKEGLSQQKIYENALHQNARRVTPRWGIIDE